MAILSRTSSTPSRARRQISCILVASLALLAACGGGSGADPAPAPAPAQTPTPAPAQTPAPPPAPEPADPRIASILEKTSSGATVFDSNVAMLYIDGGPSPSVNMINAVYADVKICAPNDPSNCTIVDHMLVDTGSVGVRIIASALPKRLLDAMPARTDTSGKQIAQCHTFAGGTTWGSLRSADFFIGGPGPAYNGLSAPGILVQAIADPASAVAAVPASCASTGGMMQTFETLGAKGILGIGMKSTDCGPACESTPTHFYYACPSDGSSCSKIPMPVSQQVPNPVSRFASDSNGTIIALPNIGKPNDSWAASARGLLVFGIGTRPNNQPAPNSAFLLADSNNVFSSAFNGLLLPSSFFDSGSSLNYFPSAGAFSMFGCSTLPSFFYCPFLPMIFTAINYGANGSTSTVEVLVNNLDRLYTGANYLPRAIAGAGGNLSTIPESLAYGTPSFFGREIGTLLSGQSSPALSFKGPAFLHTP